MNYPLCQFAEAETFARWPDFSVSECRQCGFRYVDTSSPAYPKDAQYVYDEPAIGEIILDQPPIRRRVRDVLRFLGRRVGRSRRALESGFPDLVPCGLCASDMSHSEALPSGICLTRVFEPRIKVSV